VAAAFRPPFDPARLLNLAEDPNWLATLDELVALSVGGSAPGADDPLGRPPFPRGIAGAKAEAFPAGGTFAFRLH
jgi:hypothetical protein